GQLRRILGGWPAHRVRALLRYRPGRLRFMVGSDGGADSDCHNVVVVVESALCSEAQKPSGHTERFSSAIAAYVFSVCGSLAIAALTRSGVKGTSRKRAPAASKIALPMAAGVTVMEVSPAPR